MLVFVPINRTGVLLTVITISDRIITQFYLLLLYVNIVRTERVIVLSISIADIDIRHK